MLIKNIKNEVPNHDDTSLGEQVGQFTSCRSSLDTSPRGAKILKDERAFKPKKLKRFEPRPNKDASFFVPSVPG